MREYPKKIYAVENTAHVLICIFPSAEYDRLHRKRVTIIETLADLGLTRALAEKLWSSGMIARRTYDEAKIVAPNVTEIDRATAVFNAVLASVKLNRAKYDKFVGTLKEVGGSDDLVAFIEGRFL